MKDILYRKIYRALNEDLNMILSDDDFDEPELDLDIHMQNIQKKTNFLLLKKNVTKAIENNDLRLLKDIIEKQWDGETVLYSVNDDNIKYVVKFSVHALGIKANLNWIDTSNVTDMKCMFQYSKFNGDISGWDVSSVTNMDSMFYHSDFNGDIDRWDVSNVTSMKHMFYNSKFTGDISWWDVSSVTNMQGMFEYSGFNEDISGWSVSKVTNMSYMFYGSTFNGDISKWDVSSVINMDAMFYDSQFNGDISKWSVSSVINMSYMFDNCPIKEEYKPKFND